MKIGNLSWGFVLRELQGCKWCDQQGLRSNWRISFGYSVVCLHESDYVTGELRSKWHICLGYSVLQSHSF